MIYGRLGRTQEARAAAEAWLRRFPQTSLVATRLMYAHYRRPEDLAFRISALREAGIPEWPYGFRPPAAGRLDGAAIRTLAVDRTWMGHQQNGQPFAMQVSAGGDYVQRTAQGMVVGKVTFEDDLMCMRTEAILLGRKVCSPVFRNPGGSSATQDEYVFPDYATVWYFSVAE